MILAKHNSSDLIGGWRFDRSSGELRREGVVRRLEPRAALALTLLLDAEGDVVCNQDLIEQVWGGRRVSENSVSIVIGQIRRALDDGKRILIENVPKRGYRLRPGASRGEEEIGPRYSRIATLLLLTAIASSLTFVLLQRLPHEPVTVIVENVSNETGDWKYEPHARATSELIVNGLTERGFRVHRGDQSGEIEIHPRLVIWDGEPYLGLTATDRSGVIRWSAMMPGAPPEVPTNVSRALDRFESQMEQH